MIFSKYNDSSWSSIYLNLKYENIQGSVAIWNIPICYWYQTIDWCLICVWKWLLERFPHRPLIQDGLHNISELVNASVVFECLVLSELEPHLEWRRGLVVEGDDETKFELIRQVPGSKLKIGALVRSFQRCINQVSLSVLAIQAEHTPVFSF